MLMLEEHAPASKAPRRRKKRQRQRLLYAFSMLTDCDPRITVLGEDLLFTALLQNTGDNPPTAAPYQLLFNGVATTVVGIPDRLLAKPAPMARLTSVKNRMEALGRRCIFVPQSSIGGHQVDGEAVVGVLSALLGQMQPPERKLADIGSLPFFLPGGHFAPDDCAPC